MDFLRIYIVYTFAGLWPVGAAELDFARDIRSILSDKCYNCHGPDKKARKGKLRLHDRPGVMESGVLSDGEMLARLTSEDPDERMPPAKSNRVLSDEDRSKLVQWLKAGARWPEDDQALGLRAAKAASELPRGEKWPSGFATALMRLCWRGWNGRNCYSPPMRRIR